MSKKLSTKTGVHISEDLQFAYIEGVHAAITMEDSTQMFEKPSNEPVVIKKGYRGFVPWGEDNKTPTDVRNKVGKVEMLSSNLLFNVQVMYGSGLEYGEIITDDNGMKKFKPKEFPEVKEFFKYIDVAHFLVKQATDLNFFYNCFPEIILNKERKVVAISSKDATMCRWESMNPTTGYIENMFYSSKFAEGETPEEKDAIIIPVLKDDNPVRDAMIRTGKLHNNEGKTKDLGEDRFIVPVNFPTPGRLYYQKPYWYALFESGWYDFAVAIPQYKKYLMQNQATVKYHIKIHRNYFKDIFASEGIIEDKKQKERIKLEYENLKSFLQDVKNTGKSIISYVDYNGKGVAEDMLKIEVIDDKFKGGEYLEDSEEASNILSYAMGVHPSMNGSSPGKNKSINGTEARELFIIKQALMKPFRDILLRPFYVIKALNEWPDELEFNISNLVLTTLDKGTGSQKIIS